MSGRLTSKVFFDTTILIYAVSEGDERAAVAESLLASGGHLSVQVLNEFAAVARRKLGMTWEQVGEALAAIRALCATPAPLSLAINDDALRIAARYGYQIYDALILAAALDMGCTVLYSEDMQHGQRIDSLDVDSLVIFNPFAA